MKGMRWLLLVAVVATAGWSVGLSGCSGGDGGTPVVGTERVAAENAADLGEAEAVTFGQNVVRNGGAESNVGGSGAGSGPAPVGWSRTGPLEVIKYGAAGGFPTPSTPGPPSRGRNFFSGGYTQPPSKIEQSVSLSWAAAVIDQGKATYALSAYLGGFGSDGDNAKVEVKFLNASRSVLAKRAIGPVTNAQRGNVTSLLRRAASGAVPRGTRSVKIQLILTKVVGSYNDGYADNISLVLNRLP